MSTDNESSKRKVKVHALFPIVDRAATRFKQTLLALSHAFVKFDRENVQSKEFLNKTPRLGMNWIEGNANKEISQVSLNNQTTEEKKILNAILKKTAQDKIRQEKATADRLEAEATKAKSEARIAQMEELFKRAELIEKWRQLGIILKIEGCTISFMKAGDGCDWGSVALDVFMPQEIEMLRMATANTASNLESHDLPQSSADDADSSD